MTDPWEPDAMRKCDNPACFLQVSFEVGFNCGQLGHSNRDCGCCAVSVCRFGCAALAIVEAKRLTALNERWLIQTQDQT